MVSISFPQMFSSASTNLVYDRDATWQNLKTSLLIDKGSMFGDPHWGSGIKRLMFEQNSSILRDIVIDDIYNNIANFMPQVRVQRKDIEINSDGSTLYASIRAKNLIDFQLETVNIALFNLEELE